MRCYYRNGISCGENRRELEDQSVIKGKIKIKWDKTKLVSDELKSHLFLVHFSVVFHLKINNYYTEI